MTAKTFHEINFHPWYNNVLDYVDKPLVIIGGFLVVVKRNGLDFDVWLNNKPFAVGQSNNGASFALNMMQTGVMG